MVASYSDLMAAANAVADPSTPAADLADIASRHPSLWADIAAHPAASPTVLDSLAALGNDQIKATVAARRTAHPEPATPVPDERPTAAQQVAAPPPTVDAPSPRRLHRWLIALLVSVALVVSAVLTALLLQHSVIPPSQASSVSPSIGPLVVPNSTPAPTPTNATTDQATPTESPATTKTTLPADDPSAQQAAQALAAQAAQAEQAHDQALSNLPTLPATAMTSAQFRTLYTTTWPKVSGEWAMKSMQPDVFPTNPDCSLATTWLAQHVTAQATASSNTVIKGSTLDLVLFDSADAVQQFSSMLNLCYGQSGQITSTDASTIAYATSNGQLATVSSEGSNQVTVVYEGTEMPGVMYTATVIPASDGQYTTYYATVWGNVALTCQFPAGQIPTDKFAASLMPAFTHAVDQAIG